MTVAVPLMLVSPRPAAADIINQSPWTNLAATTDRSTTISADYTVTATPGSDRLLLVTMVTRFGFDQAIDVTSASFGGVQLHEIVEGSSLTTRNGVWMGYLLDSEILAGEQTLSVSFTSTVSDPTGTKLLGATYVGVDQANPANDSSANNTDVDAPIPFGSQIDYVSNAEVVYVASFGGNTNFDTIEPAGYSKIYTNEWSGLMVTTVAHKDDTSTAGSSPGTTAVDFVGTDVNHSLAVVALNPSSTNDPQTIVLHPTSDGVPIQYGTYPFDSDNFDVVNDQTGNAGTGPPEAYDGANYLWGNIGQRAMLALDDGTIPAGSTITEISIHAQTNRAGGQANLSLSYQRKAGATTPDASPIDGAGNDLGNACCTEIVETWSGLSWTTDDLNNLEIGAVQNSGDGDSRISQLYVLVSYIEGESSASISGVVFEDADFAGSATDWDGGTGDAGLPNVDVELYDSSDVYQTSTATDGSGNFSFTGLADGTYKVRARSATIGDDNTPPQGTLNASVDATWPYPLPEMTWANGNALYGGQNPTVDDTDTADDAGPGDTYVPVTVSGADETGVNFGFAYNLIVNTEDDGSADNARSAQGSLRQFMKNANAIGSAGGTTANSSEFRLQVATNQSDGADSWWRITAAAEMPALQDPGTSLDGSTQRQNGGVNTNTRGPEIEIHGNGVTGSGLDITGSVVIREVVVNAFTGGSTGDGIHISGAAASGSGIYACYIGTDAVGGVNAANGDSGIEIVNGALGCSIGGAGGEGNVISGNSDDGLYIDAASTGTTVMGNMIGTNAAGTAPVGNGGSGCDIKGSGTIIGGSGAGEGNVISGSNYQGLTLDDDFITVEGNHIGVNATGTADIPNGRIGVWIIKANCVIGGTDPGAGNVISGNGWSGIRIEGAGATLNTVQGNVIGLNATADAAIANLEAGIQIWQGATENLVGGAGPGEGNTIAGNSPGVVVTDAGTIDNAILGNAIYDNSGLGIDLGGDGVTENGGADSYLDFPVINTADESGGTVTVTGTLDAPLGNYRVEFFSNALGADPSGNGEGQTPVGSTTLAHAGSGAEPFVAAFSGSSGDVITATATEDLGASYGSSSEFGDAVTVLNSRSISGLVFEDADFAGTAANWDGGTNDQALANVDVELYDNSDVYQASVTTDGSGIFSFTGLTDGTYKVRARSATIGDADTLPAGGFNPAVVPGTWPYPLAEMTWASGAALIGGQDHSVDDTATGDNAGSGDTWVTVAVSGADVSGVNLGFSYDVIVNEDDDANADNFRSKQGTLRQFIKNSNAIMGVNKSWFQIPSP